MWWCHFSFSNALSVDFVKHVIRYQNYRSKHRRCSVRKGFLGNFAKLTGKHLCKRLFFDKVAALRPATRLKERLWHRCFPVDLAKFLRTPFLQNTSERLLLGLCKGATRIFKGRGHISITGHIHFHDFI